MDGKRGFGAALLRMGAGVILTLALSACGRDAASEAQEETTAVFTRSDNIAALVLQPMNDDELVDYELTGDITCRFARSAGEGPLLIASANVRDEDSVPQVLVKYADMVTEASTGEAGGFEAIAAGGAFDASAMQVEVALSREDESRAGQQATPLHAFMRIVQAGEDDIVTEGYWTCTP